MAEQEKQCMQAMADAIADLPEARKQYFLGYAEGVVAMAELSRLQSTTSSHKNN